MPGKFTQNLYFPHLLEGESEVGRPSKRMISSTEIRGAMNVSSKISRLKFGEPEHFLKSESVAFLPLFQAPLCQARPKSCIRLPCDTISASQNEVRYIRGVHITDSHDNRTRRVILSRHRDHAFPASYHDERSLHSSSFCECVNWFGILKADHTEIAQSAIPIIRSCLKTPIGYQW